MNSFGKLFKMTTWGESHGKAVGVVIDGCPAGLKLTEREITGYLQKNDRPIIELATERNEPNVVKILSGVNRGKTIGTPISILIKNCDVKKKDYGNISEVFRPGHGDFTYHMKYDIPVLSGGGRASGRECITRIAAGYIADKIIKNYIKEFDIETDIESLAGVFIRDDESMKKALAKCMALAEKGDSSGGLIRITIKGIPSGIGEPVFHGINSTIAQGLMTIKTIKSIEIGTGKKCSAMSGSEFNDEFCINEDRIGFAHNNSGGILSGITNGNDIVIRIAVKPTPSIRIKKNFATLDNKIKQMSVNGRHDKNITPRIGPIAKAMIDVVLLNYLMIAGVISRDKLR